MSSRHLPKQSEAMATSNSPRRARSLDDTRAASAALVIPSSRARTATSGGSFEKPTWDASSSQALAKSAQAFATGATTLRMSVFLADDKASAKALSKRAPFIERRNTPND